MKKHLNVALVHDWLTGMRGGEKVLEVLCELYPDATLFTLLHNDGAMSPIIEGMNIRTSFIQNLPFKETKYRNYLPLMPRAIESFDFSGFDLILSTSHAVAKGAIPRENALHICYCLTPMRYVWEQYDDYFGKGRAGLLTRTAMEFFAPRLRAWDVQASSRVHYFIADSRNVADRISRYYNREAEVIYAPVNTSQFKVSKKDKGYFLIVSALVPYKRLDLAVRAFNQLRERLLIVGSGPGRDELQELAAGNVEFLGWQSDKELSRLYAGCRAVIFPGVEDFGIVPLEAMASGKPVIAFAHGGVLETVVERGKNPTGIFFHDQTVNSLVGAIAEFGKKKFDPAAIRKHAERFDKKIFGRKLKAYIDRKVDEHFQTTLGRRPSP